jgi:hypothetical protein
LDEDAAKARFHRNARSGLRTPNSSQAKYRPTSGQGSVRVCRLFFHIKGRPAAFVAAPQVRFESALSLGDVRTLGAPWHELNVDSLGAV